MCFCHLNHCIDYRAGIRSVHGIAEQPVLPAYCEWTNRIFTEIVVRGKVILQSQGKEFFTWHGKDFFT